MTRLLLAGLLIVLLCASLGVEASAKPTPLAKEPPTPVATPSAAPGQDPPDRFPTPPENPEPPYADEGTGRVLTLPEAAYEALRNHPRILRSIAQAEGATALAKGAGQPTNPRFQIGLATIDNNNNNNQVNQDLDIFGQYGLRIRAGTSDARAAQFNVHAVRRDVVKNVAIAYYTYWGTSQKYKLAREYFDGTWYLWRRAIEKSGEGSHAALRANLERVRAQADLLTYHAAKQAALTKLNASMGRLDSPDLQLPGQNDSIELDAPADPYPAELPPLENLLKSADDRPEVQQARWQFEGAAYRLGLTRMTWLPYLSVQGNLSRWNYATASRGFQFFFQLPIWDWGQLKAQRGAQAQEVEAALQHIHEILVDIHADLRIAHVAWIAASRQQRELRQRCPEFRDTLLNAVQSYADDRLSIDDTLNTFKSVRDALMDYLTAEANHHRARIEVLYLSGLRSPSEAAAPRLPFTEPPKPPNKHPDKHGEVTAPGNKPKP